MYRSYKISLLFSRKTPCISIKDARFRPFQKKPVSTSERRPTALPSQAAFPDFWSRFPAYSMSGEKIKSCPCPSASPKTRHFLKPMKKKNTESSAPKPYLNRGTEYP